MSDDLRETVRYLVTHPEDETSRDDATRSLYHEKKGSLSKKQFSQLKQAFKDKLDVESSISFVIEGKKKEEKKYTALRDFPNVLYRQVVDVRGFAKFARFDKTTREIFYVDRIPETEEYPVNVVKLVKITFPRELKGYGTPLELYTKLKARIDYVSSQSGHKNHVFVLFLMYHGCVPSFTRKNLQLVPMGPAGKGKGRYAEMAHELGDRARFVTDPTFATAYRLNALLNGGLEILDEMPDDDPDVEKYIRSRYDPDAAEYRLMDPHSVDEIVGFRIAGPTLITRRRGFSDDANTDRGIILKCENPVKAIPLEIIDHSVDKDLLDQLAMFWTEYFGDTRLLPTEAEMMYDPADPVDCRLRLAATYLMKLAALIGTAAVEDMKSFIGEQEGIRRELKAITPEGSALRALWEIIQAKQQGEEYSTSKKDGVRIKILDQLSHENRFGKCVIYITRTEEIDGREPEVKSVGINWTLIANKAELGRELPSKLLQPYSVAIMYHGPSTKRFKTIGFDISKLDSAFKSFLPEYEGDWKTSLVDLVQQKFDPEYGKEGSA